MLDVDRQYRAEAAAGALKKIARRRFESSGEAWLPVFHTARGPRQYTALFSNTVRAHELNKTQDWVVLYYDGASGERRAPSSPPNSARSRGNALPGREKECREHYGEREIPGAAVRKGVVGPGMRVK